jgi:antitoxin component YwqK of YwqJK toxin-antitoxin module
MKKLLLILLCVPFIGFSQERHHIDEVEFNEQSKTYSLRESGETIKNGVIFSGKNRIKSEQKIVNGQVVSFVKYYRNGNMEVELNLEDNDTSNCVCEGNGFEIWYYNTGEVAEEGSVKNHLPHGYWKYYFPGVDEDGDDMEVAEEGNYINGKKDGLWKKYKLNGTIKEIRYKNGKKIK